MRPPDRAMAKGTFLFCSSLALYQPLFAVAEIISRNYGVAGHVIAPEDSAVSPVYHPSGRLGRVGFDASGSSLAVHFLPARKGDIERFGFDRQALRLLLKDIQPDYIWIHEEFWQGIAQQFLEYYRLQRTPRIIAYVAVNHIAGPTPLLSARWPFISRTRIRQRLLWPRLNEVVSCATKSMECARRMGLPENIPVTVNYLPIWGPEHATGDAVALPWPREGSFTIAFVGLLSEQKGWKVLLAAMELLPGTFKVVLMGDGEQREELLSWLKRPDLQGRAYFAGSLPKERLLASYPLCDVLVLPSITTPHSVEQFGAVLAEAMAFGVPLIGSDSGAIPETVGEAGLIVPENDPQSLAEAIRIICEDQELHCRAATRGLERFRRHYNCERYAQSIAQALKITEC
jgi:glycosyltransferase involved in cell wall biosynthesis